MGHGSSVPPQWFPFYRNDSNLNALFRRFGTEEAEGIEGMDYPNFAGAIARAGFHLSTSETKTLFKKFRLTSECGECRRLKQRSGKFFGAH